jgi:hypothetical protein
MEDPGGRFQFAAIIHTYEWLREMITATEGIWMLQLIVRGHTALRGPEIPSAEDGRKS